MKKLLLLSVAFLPTTALTAPSQSPDEKVRAIAAEVSPDRMHQTVERLVGFGTRHTLSTQTDPKRGIGAAVRWAEGEMKKLGLEALQTCDTVTGRRVPTPTRVCNAVGIQRGTERPNDVVIIQGHIDSRVTDVMNATADAPGANDDGSGTAAVLEAARVLTQRKFPGTIVYATLSGEEQGLLGGKILADYAKTQGWNVVTVLNNDIIATAARPTAYAMTSMSASCRKGRVCRGRPISPRRPTASAAKTMLRRATSRAFSMASPIGSTSAST